MAAVFPHKQGEKAKGELAYNNGIKRSSGEEERGGSEGGSRLARVFLCSTVMTVHGCQHG